MTEAKSLRVGYIGLGVMGQPMARNLIKAGYGLAVWARRRASAEALLAEGADWADSPADLARQVDVLLVNVSDTPDVEAVLLGDGGVAEGARPGLVVVDHSTISADATRAMAETLSQSGVELIDAPVSGGDVGARAGILSIMCGGREETIERLRPLLETMGTVLRIGEVGAGQVCKACNQILVAQQMAAVGEALMLAERMGTDPAKVRQALLGGFAGSRILEVHGQRILDDDFAPGFRAELHDKDMRLALEAARERGLSLPGAELAAGHLRRMVAEGLGGEDSSAMYKVIAGES